MELGKLGGLALETDVMRQVQQGKQDGPGSAQLPSAVTGLQQLSWKLLQILFCLEVSHS